MKIRKNDQVKMISGKDRGKTGKVMRVLVKEEKIIVEGLNLIKKHNRPKKEGEKGQRVEVPRAVSISNVMVVCPKCSKVSRLGYKISKGNKFRFCKECKSEI
jgi:large subunit ribosomal protein L24